MAFALCMNNQPSSHRHACYMGLGLLTPISTSLFICIYSYTLANQMNHNSRKHFLKDVYCILLKQSLHWPLECKVMKAVMASMRLSLEAGDLQRFGLGNSFLLVFTLTMKMLSHSLSPLFWV